MLSKEYRDYAKTILISLGVLCVAHLYVFSHFWWGNHDWGYLKSGASIKSGFFEARYSQHLFTVLFLDGHILPVFTFLSGLLCVIIQSILIGKYFKLEAKYWPLIALFIGMNPHIYAFMYYVYLFLPFMSWSLISVALLFLVEGNFKFYKNFLFVLGCVGVLGSYPPNLAFVFVLFVGKRIICYLSKEENIKDSLKKTIYFGLLFLLSVLFFKVIYTYLQQNHLLNDGMYNLEVKSLSSMIIDFPFEVVRAFSQLLVCFSFLGMSYVLPLFLLVILSLVIVYRKSENKFFAIFGILLLFLSSRFSFIVSAQSEVALFRVLYWGRLGVYVFALCVLLKQSGKLVRNVLFSILCFVFFNFAVLSAHIQKVQNMGFIAGRLYQKRLLDMVVMNDSFDVNNEYISLSLGQPNFREKFYPNKHNTAELTGLNFVFEFDVVNFLFWEYEKSPIIIGAGINGRNIIRVDRGGEEKWRDIEYWSNNPENMKKIRYWLYMIAKPYPDKNFIYVDDKYIIVVLDKPIFYNHRELVAKSLDE